MRLIKSLDSRPRKNQPGKKKRKDRYGLFYCSFCHREVERTLGHGGRDKSCGCASLKLIGLSKRIHGGGGTRLYAIWKNMRRRCYNPKSKEYKWYGSRGIIVCDKWKNDFLAFKKWALKNGYQKDLTIDRADNNGNYTPENCCFIPLVENCIKNRRVRLNIKKAREIRKKYRSGKYLQKDLAQEYDIPRPHVSNIIANKCWVENEGC